MKILPAIAILSAAILNAEICCDDPIDGRGEPLSFLYKQNSCYTIDVEAAFLYWEALSDGFDYVYSFVENITELGNTYQSDAALAHANFGWKSAPRVSLGVAGTLWDTKATWTHFESNDSQEFLQEVFQSGGSGPLVRRLNLIWQEIISETGHTPVADETSATQVSASGKVKYTTVDWVAGYSIAFNDYFYLRPFFGARAVWLDQKMKFDAINEFVLDADDFYRKSIRQINMFRAAGLHFGAQSKYRAANWFSFYSEGAFSLLAGSFTVKSNQVAYNEVIPEYAIGSTGKFSHPALRPAMMLGAGIELNYSFCQDSMFLELTGGYEVNYWPYQNQWIRVFGINQEFKQPGDFVLHGVVVQGAFIY